MPYVPGQPITISVIVPAFNESRNIPLLLNRLIPILNGIGDYQVLFINDGSQDDSAEVLRDIHRSNPRVMYVTFSRNFGHQAALKAGLERAVGDVVITMDADLQHPPEVITDMVAKWREGFDVVLGTRAQQRNSLAKRTSSRIFYLLLNLLSDTKILPGAADFRLHDRRIVTIINNLPERTLFLRGLVAWLGFRQTAVSYVEDSRQIGETRYTLTKMIALAWDAITSFSIRPLRLATLLGLLLFFLSALYGVFILASFFLWPETLVPGWASVIFVILLLGGVQFVVLGIIGEYLGRLVIESRRRPSWIISESSDNFSR